jgi:hypothetical protein
MTLAIDQLSADVNLLKRWHAERPSRSYVPGRAVDLEGEPIPEVDRGQLQFHRSLAKTRLMAPGNGSGKTTSLAFAGNTQYSWGVSGSGYYVVRMPAGRQRLTRQAPAMRGSP